MKTILKVKLIVVMGTSFALFSNNSCNKEHIGPEEEINQGWEESVNLCSPDFQFSFYSNTILNNEINSRRANQSEIKLLSVKKIISNADGSVYYLFESVDESVNEYEENSFDLLNCSNMSPVFSNVSWLYIEYNLEQSLEDYEDLGVLYSI